MSASQDAVAATKLTRTEFAVVRAYAQGMRPVEIANRYLLDPDDDGELSEHQAIQRILGLRDRLVQFALQHERHDIAEMFDALKGRSNTGMGRRVDALSQLERLGQGTPHLDHAVGLWFGPSLARRLQAAGIGRISDLVTLANRRGGGWWRGVPRIGALSGEVVTRWLLAQKGHLRAANGHASLAPHVVPSSAHAARPQLQPLPLASAMAYPVPLESMLRGQRTAIDVSGHADALALVRQWLAHRARSTSTYQGYRRECERLLLWCAKQEKDLLSLAAPDILAYAGFLADPQPAAFWQGPAGPRDRHHWRPFEGGLSQASRRAALRIVRALFTFLHKHGHTAHNPVAALETVASASAHPAPARSEPAGAAPDLLDAFISWLGHPAHGARHRTAHAVALLMRRSGLRLREVAALRWSQLRREGEAMWIQIEARNPVRRRRPVDSETIGVLQTHWRDRGLSDGSMPAQCALVGPLNLPDTQRGRNKALAGPLAAYSGSGLETLLRAMWMEFARQAGGPLAQEIRFTPRALVGAA